MEEQPAQILVQYCKASDLNAGTGECAAPFYGPPPAVIPRLSAADAYVLTAAIASCWAVGFVIKRARRTTY